MASPYQLTSERLSQRAAMWLGRKLDQLEIEECLGQEYRSLTESYDWSWLMLEGFLLTQVPKSDGTVAVVANGTTVTGTGTAFASTDVGRRFRLTTNDVSFSVMAVNTGLQTLTIDPAYNGATASGASYTLYKNIYQLPDTVSYLFSIAGRSPLRPITVGELDRMDPTRASTADVSTHFAYRGQTAIAELEIEVYPIPTASEVIRWWGIRRDGTVTSTGAADPLHVLRGLESVLLHATVSSGCLILAAKGGQPGVWTDLASAHKAKADQILDRLLSLDMQRSAIPTVQQSRDDFFLYDPDYIANHDVGNW